MSGTQKHVTFIDSKRGTSIYKDNVQTTFPETPSPKAVFQRGDEETQRDFTNAEKKSN